MDEEKTNAHQNGNEAETWTQLSIIFIEMFFAAASKRTQKKSVTNSDCMSVKTRESEIKSKYHSAAI